MSRFISYIPLHTSDTEGQVLNEYHGGGAVPVVHELASE